MDYSCSALGANGWGLDHSSSIQKNLLEKLRGTISQAMHMWLRWRGYITLSLKKNTQVTLEKEHEL